MKIKTITCQHVYNYGASLQAFALQEYLNNLGHDVEIIDFRLPSHRRYELFSPNPKGRLYPIFCKFPFLGHLIAFIQNRRMLKTWSRKIKFDKFDKVFLNLSENTFHSLKELQQANLEADVFIAGSDQIWNTDMENGTCGAYFLDFGSSKSIKISYAASFGINFIKEEDKRLFIKNSLSNFDKISVREKSALKILGDLGFEGIQVVDPVFLLSKTCWINKLNLSLQNREYVFLYDFTHDDPNISKYALELAKSENLPIYSINDSSSATYADVQINDAGPREFLNLLLNAKYVVSNSFHATAFSIIFDKKFVTFPLLSQRNSSRMIDLLNSSNLISRYCPSDIAVIQKEINNIHNLRGAIDESKNFLKTCLISADKIQEM